MEHKLKLKASVTGTSRKITGLKKGTRYRAYVKAWKKVDGKKKYIGKASPTVYAIAGNAGGKWTNAKKVSVKPAKLTLKKGKKATLKATQTGARKGKSVLKTVALTRWYTSDARVAKVTSGGVVKAVGKGSCKIWAVANNGVRTGVKVTVK